ncbi:MAG: FUSC family protein [Minicystis sp.]
MRRETTRMGLRAGVAAALVVALTRLFALPRSYWAVLVAVVIVGETWGDSVRLGLQRLGMTALGCVAGAVLHAAVAPHPTVEVALLFVGVFLAAYFRVASGAGSYPWMIFFITVYVVFLFAIFDRTHLHDILFIRVIDTAVGCGAALTAAIVVRPRAAGRQLGDDLRDLWDAYRALVEEAPACSADTTALLRRVDALRVRLGASAYESFLSDARRRAAALVRGSEGLGHAVISLARRLDEARGRALPPPIEAGIQAVRGRVIAALRALAASPPLPIPEPVSLSDRVEEAHALLAAGCLGHDDFVLVGAIFVHAEDACLHLTELRRILRRA